MIPIIIQMYFETLKTRKHYLWVIELKYNVHSQSYNPCFVNEVNCVKMILWYTCTSIMRDVF